MLEVDAISAVPAQLNDNPSNEHAAFCVIPAYRASETIGDVIAQCLQYADGVVVVDDACPEGSGRIASRLFFNDSRVTVVTREINGGVGAATKTGIRVALGRGAGIIVKIDADGQMDPSYIPTIRRIIADDPSVACIKGNRFFDAKIMDVMPKLRLIGNSALSLLAKGASGYWNAIDPTNGYLAFNASILKLMPWESFADTYFFELSVLCELGLKRLPVIELEMPTVYTDAPSSLSIRRVALEFPPKLIRYTLRRLLLQYIVFDFNLATLYGLVGTALLTFSALFGSYEWVDGVVRHVAKPTGTVMLAVLPFLMGFQLLLNALMYDVQFSVKTYHELLVNRSRTPLRRLH